MTGGHFVSGPVVRVGEVPTRITLPTKITVPTRIALPS